MNRIFSEINNNNMNENGFFLCMKSSNESLQKSPLDKYNAMGYRRMICFGSIFHINALYIP